MTKTITFIAILFLFNFHILNNIAEAVDPVTVTTSNGSGELAAMFPEYATALNAIEGMNTDDSHTANAIACCTDLRNTMAQMIAEQRNAADGKSTLDEMIELRSKVAMLKVGRAYVRMRLSSERGNRTGTSSSSRCYAATDEGITENLDRALDSTSASPPSEDRTNLELFYRYIRNKDTGAARPEMGATLAALKTYSETDRQLGSFGGQRYKLNDNDIYIFNELYNKYQPATTGQEDSSNLFNRTMDELTRAFGGEAAIKCSDQTAIQDQWSKTDRKLTAATTKFKDETKVAIKAFLRDKPNHPCTDFYQIDSGNLTKVGDRPQCTSLSLLDQVLSPDDKLDNLTNILNFVQPFNPGNVSFAPHIHAREVSAGLKKCEYKRAQNGDWLAEVEIEMEHMHGVGNVNAQWFVNTGQERITGDDPSFNSCTRANPLTTLTTESVSNDYITSSECIDTPLSHNESTKHKTTVTRTINLGDTRQTNVTLVGTSSPTTTGNPEMTKDISLSKCEGALKYAKREGKSINVDSVEIEVAVGDEVAAEEDKISLKAKITPAQPDGARGTFRWTCNENSLTDNCVKDVCGNDGKKSLGTTTNNSELSDLKSYINIKQCEVTFQVKAQYFSTVQRPDKSAEYTIPVKPIQAVVARVTAAPTFTFEISEDKNAKTEDNAKFEVTSIKKGDTNYTVGTVQWKYKTGVTSTEGSGTDQTSNSRTEITPARSEVSVTGEVTFTPASEGDTPAPAPIKKPFTIEPKEVAVAETPAAAPREEECKEGDRDSLGACPKNEEERQRLEIPQGPQGTPLAPPNIQVPKRRPGMTGGFL
ncbi:MAG: hypothetical protein HOJ35_05775 [Bdellovibrionales bacterium]|nr:hypothetical protein [Bdellovibrionales bacterium]